MALACKVEEHCPVPKSLYSGLRMIEVCKDPSLLLPPGLETISPPQLRQALHPITVVVFIRTYYILQERRPAVQNSECRKHWIPAWRFGAEDFVGLAIEEQPPNLLEMALGTLSGLALRTRVCCLAP